MPFQKNDFIEIEFTGRVKDGEVFDSNLKKDLEKLHQGHSHEIEAKPLIICIGQGMFLKGVEDYLAGKEIGAYEISLTPEKAFGNRAPQLVQMIPSKIFREQKLNPFPGATFNFDGRVGKILTVSGGRVMIDFNNPLAGKDVSYKINVLRKVESLDEKIKSFIDFLFRQDLKFEVKEKTLIIYSLQQMKKFIELFGDKFKEIFDLDLKVEKTDEETRPSVAELEEVEEEIKEEDKEQAVAD
ncbi:peptidylprolyl isomerase [Candidatus Pacearchaeota archaeon]|nr:peptidylprolyl isomerase [Candidatus Pacearchaeota archaeon]